jgi:hypothetical protein
MTTQCGLEGTADKAIMDCFKRVLHAGPSNLGVKQQKI